MKEKITSLSIVQTDVRSIFWSIGLIIASVVAPALLAHTPQNQWITGTLINAFLFLAVWKVGLINAFFVGVFPSSIALLRGLLPAPMALLVPYIILSNILMLSVAYAMKKNTLSVTLSALIKFIWLFAISSIFAAKLSSPLLSMMQLPQLITALAGGFLAMGIVKVSTKTKTE